MHYRLTRSREGREGALQVPKTNLRVLPRELVDGDNDTASREDAKAAKGFGWEERHGHQGFALFAGDRRSLPRALKLR